MIGIKQKKTETVKYFVILIFTGFFTIVITPASAQKLSSNEPITINDIAAAKVWQIAEMAMNDNKIPVGVLNIEKGLLMSDWFEWTTIDIQNHARFYFNYNSPNLVLKIADRGIKSANRWIIPKGSLSEEDYAEYMQALADRISEINKDETLTQKAIKTSKLIPAFSPVNTVDDLVFTLRQTHSPENHPVLKFTVLNKASIEVTADIPKVSLKQSATEGANHFGYQEWSRPEAIPSMAIIKPGESLTLTVKYDYDWNFTNIPRLDLKIISTRAGSKKTETLSIYDIPLADYVFKPEQ